MILFSSFCKLKLIVFRNILSFFLHLVNGDLLFYILNTCINFFKELPKYYLMKLIIIAAILSSLITNKRFNIV